MASVEIRSVRKTYGDTRVLHGVSIDIADGEFVTLVGPSGCGKSTLLKMIAGLEDISDGEIAVDGQVINDIAPKDRDNAMVFQSYALYPHMTVAQNIGFPLRMKHRPRTEVRARTQRAASILALDGLLDRLPRQLSGGQRQRVAMARAIVREPKVFLFDEPLSNLDATLRVHMRTELKLLHRQLGTTTIFVTHDQVEAMMMADRIVVLNAGVVEQAGSPLDLYDRPQNRFVAGFIGLPAMNFFPGTIRVGSTPSFMSDGGLSFALPDAPAGFDGRRAVCGIRPEHFELSVGEVKFEVVDVEPTGLDTQVLARAMHHDVIGLFRERVSAKPGDHIRLAPVPTCMHMFDAETGARMF